MSTLKTSAHFIGGTRYTNRYYIYNQSIPHPHRTMPTKIEQSPTIKQNKHRICSNFPIQIQFCSFFLLEDLPKKNSIGKFRETTILY